MLNNYYVLNLWNNGGIINNGSKKKKKATRKKTSKIVEQSTASNELIEKIKANPLIALIGIAIVVGIGIFIYSSQQGTQIALNKCINKNLNSSSNKGIDKYLIESRCIQKHQKNIPSSIIEISSTYDNRFNYDVNEKCLENKMTNKEKSLVKNKKLSLFYLSNQKYPECKNTTTTKKYYSLLTNHSENYLVTEIGLNDGAIMNNLWIDYRDGIRVDKKYKKIKYVKGVKIKLK